MNDFLKAMFVLLGLFIGFFIIAYIATVLVISFG